MASFSSLRLARRPVRSRVLVLQRVDPGLAAALLPEGLRPRLVEGHGVLSLCYTRLGSLEAPFLPQRRASTHHLDFRIAAEDVESAEPTTWVARRETSSRLGARWNERILGRDFGRARFELEKDTFRMRLAVHGEHGEELHLAVELAERSGELFACPRAVQEFLEGQGEVRPHDVLAPEADAIEARSSFAPEPLRILELRSSFLAEHCTGSRTDGAWRLVTRRAVPVRERPASRLRSAPAGGGLPAF